MAGGYPGYPGTRQTRVGCLVWVASSPKLTPKARAPRRGSAVQAGAAGVIFLEGSSLVVSRGCAMPARGAFRFLRPGRESHKLVY